MSTRKLQRNHEITRMRLARNYLRAFCIWAYVIVVNDCGAWTFNRFNPLGWLTLTVASLVFGVGYFFKAIYECWTETLND